MERYKNLGHDSGISGFEIGTDSIIIEFRQGGTYLYNYESAGESNIEQMKTLAVDGKVWPLL